MEKRARTENNENDTTVAMKQAEVSSESDKPVHQGGKFVGESSSIPSFAPLPRSTPTVPKVKIDRSVETRTQYRITLPLALSSPNNSTNAVSASSDNDASVDQRGWSSPHGEPYRPLGKPDLSLKFSPRLANGTSILQNAHRMKVFEGSMPQEKEKEIRGVSSARKTSAPGAQYGSSPLSLSSSSSTQPALLDLFPLNFKRKNQPLDERQVKLAHRLHHSITHYSPEKVRGLRRRHAGHHQVQDPWQPTSSTPLQSGSTSIVLLHHAIQECAGRVRLVKNGASLLTQVPSSEIRDLESLRQEYEAASIKAATQPVSHGRDAGGSSSTISWQPKSFHQHDTGDGIYESMKVKLHDPETISLLPHIEVEEEDIYLPYTSRHPKHSPPYRQLPTVNQFRAKIREDKLPVRSGRASQIVLSSETHPRIGSLALPRSPDKKESRGSISRQSFVVAPPPSRASQRVSSPGISMTASDTADDQPMPSYITKSNLIPDTEFQIHSVERLQSAVDAIEIAKLHSSRALAKTIESLNHDRRNCLATKFKSFDVHHHIDDDLNQMRLRSEYQRGQHIEETLGENQWYIDLLRQLLAREAPLLPAETFLLQAIRRLANDGHVLQPSLLFKLILCIHHDDLVQPEVQQLLLHIQMAIGIPQEEWKDFFTANRIPRPLEPHEQHVLVQEQNCKAGLTKFRAVVTMSQVVRHLSLK